MAVTIHHGVVTLGKKALVWAGLLAGGISLVGIGVFVGVTRLDDADKWGSVVAAIVALLGLPMTAYAIVLARRGAAGAADRRTGADGGNPSVHQRVQAGRDAYTAGRDQHFGGGAAR